jgi:hypothetical protein
VIYLPPNTAWMTKSVVGLEPDVAYRAWWFSPIDGEVRSIGPVAGDADGRWTVPAMLPMYHDWVLVLERA